MIKHLLNERKLTAETIKSHNIYYSQDKLAFIFPIYDEYSRKIARTEYRPGREPKYMHHFDTDRPVLYNAHKLKEAFYGQPVFVTEGIMDALHIEQCGYVAVTALSARLSYAQQKIIERYTDTIIIAFDSDEAGMRGADKILERSKSKKFGRRGSTIFNFKFSGAKDIAELGSKDSAALSRLLGDTISKCSSRGGHV